MEKGVGAAAAARALAPVLGGGNPLGRWRAAGFALAGLIGGAVGYLGGTAIGNSK